MRNETRIMNATTYTDVYFGDRRFGCVEQAINPDTGEYEWRVYTAAFDTNRKVVDRAEGVAYLEALIALGRGD